MCTEKQFINICGEKTLLLSCFEKKKQLIKIWWGKIELDSIKFIAFFDGN